MNRPGSSPTCSGRAPEGKGRRAVRTGASSPSFAGRLPFWGDLEAGRVAAVCLSPLGLL